MQLEFEKWHGCKNDFIVITLDRRQDLVFDSIVRQAKQLCARDGSGIGADGILVLRDANLEQQSYPLTIINSDGSLASNCGNGLRCVAASVLKRQSQNLKTFETIEGIQFALKDRTIDVQLLNTKKGGLMSGPTLSALGMGTVKLNDELPWFSAAVTTVKEKLRQLDSKISVSDIGACELGNKHIVIFLDEHIPNLIYRLGPLMQTHEAWDGINVHIVTSTGDLPKSASEMTKFLKLNQTEGFAADVWERGAGPTQACGTGACAIVACATTSGMLDTSQWYTVQMQGGALFVKYDEDDQSVSLAGPAEFVFHGTIDF